jgi:hypothetical protein
MTMKMNNKKAPQTDFMKAANSVMWTRALQGTGKGLGVGLITMLTLDVFGDVTGAEILYPAAGAFGAAAGGGFGLSKGARMKTAIITKHLENKAQDLRSAPPGP